LGRNSWRVPNLRNFEIVGRAVTNRAGCQFEVTDRDFLVATDAISFPVLECNNRPNHALRRQSLAGRDFSSP
jgi:hypothetical protein